jgi:hypothetical protein
LTFRASGDGGFANLLICRPPHAVTPQEATRGGGPRRRVGVCANARALEDAECGGLSPVLNRRPVYRRNGALRSPGATFWYNSAPTLVPACHHLTVGTFLAQVSSYRVGRNLALYQARGGTAGKQSFVWGQEIRNRPQCRVTTPLWAPGADSGQREKKRNRGQNSDRKMTAVRDPGVSGR